MGVDCYKIGCGFAADMEEWLTGYVAFANEMSPLAVCIIILSFNFFSTYAVHQDEERGAADCERPGFTPDPSSNDCKCIDNAFAGLLLCPFNNGTFEASVLRGTWLGNYTVNGNNEILGGTSLFLLYTSNQSIPLPSTWEELQGGDYFCEPFHREGVLCGSCQSDYSQAINHYDCIQCSSDEAVANWFLYFSLEFLPMTLFFGVLLFFDVRTTSGPGTAFIFYAQMVNTCFDIGLDNVLIRLNPALKNLILTYKIPYGIWNLYFFSILAKPFCLLHGMDLYGVLLIRYISAFYPLLLILIVTILVKLYDRGYKPIVYICRPFHRCFAFAQRIGNCRTSAINAFAIFIVLCYTKVVFIGFNILATNYLYNSEGEIVVNNLPYFDSTVSFSSPVMIAVCIATALVLLVFGLVFPIILVVPSFLQLGYRLTKWDCFAKFMPWGRMQEFLQQFHGCYRDGTSEGEREYNVFSDRRFFSSLYLLIRLIMFLVYAFTPNNAYQYSIQTVLCFVMIFLFAVFRPFKKNRDNILNIGVFCLLGTTCSLMTFNEYEMYYMYKDISIYLLLCQYALMICPLVMVAIYFTVKLLKKLSKIVKQCRKKRRQSNDPLRSSYGHINKSQSSINTEASEEELDKDLPDFLDFTEESGRLRERDSLWQVIQEDEEEVKGSQGRKLLSITEATSYGTIITD